MANDEATLQRRYCPLCTVLLCDTDQVGCCSRCGWADPPAASVARSQPPSTVAPAVAEPPIVSDASVTTAPPTSVQTLNPRRRDRPSGAAYVSKSSTAVVRLPVPVPIAEHPSVQPAVSA